MEVVYEDMGEGNMQCTNHPYKNSTPSPGGICAFCLQEKLGKLVSSSFPVAVFPSSSSSSSASFRSDIIANGINVVNDTQRSHIMSGSSSASSSVINTRNGGIDCNNYHGNYCTTTRRSRLPFVLTHGRKKKNKKDGVVVAMGSGSNSSDSTSTVVFKRSKSTTTPRRRGMHFFDERYGKDYNNSPHKRGFWSFLYMSKHHSNVGRSDKNSSKDLNFTPATHSTVSSSATATTVAASSVKVAVNGILAINSRDNKKRDELDVVLVDENVTSDQGSYDRQVSRSRSVGCGSRSFSGDFFERISTGFVDCTLRRVESQREGRPKVQSSLQRNNSQERVRCGGIFRGFMINSSSSSYLVSTDHDVINAYGKSISASAHSNMRSNLSHGRSRRWGWALASPVRAFSKTSASVKRDSAASSKNVTPHLAAIPSLLAVSG